MNFPLNRCLLSCLILLHCAAAHADLLPAAAEAAVKRLEKNPKAFDRFDQFCSGKAAGDACTIPGSRLAGAGEGLCRNEINRQTLTIDLSCHRDGVVVIDRGLPKEGFVAEPELCTGTEPREWNCTPLPETPADRFCQGKSENQSCTVTMRYDGVQEKHEGVCREVIQRSGFYYQGHRVATRKAMLCEPEKAVVRSYQDASWLQKLRQ